MSVIHVPPTVEHLSRIWEALDRLWAQAELDGARRPTLEEELELREREYHAEGGT